jgi:hypothetical protein
MTSEFSKAEDGLFIRPVSAGRRKRAGLCVAGMLIFLALTATPALAVRGVGVQGVWAGSLGLGA